MTVVEPHERTELLALLANPRRPRRLASPVQQQLDELTALAESITGGRPWRQRRRQWPHWPNCRHTQYHLSCDEFAMLEAESGGFCDICGETSASPSHGSLDGRAAHIDHDHAIGWRAVRGLLCQSCNAAVAAVECAQRQPSRAMIEYLAHPWYARVGLEPLTCPDDCANRAHRP